MADDYSIKATIDADSSGYIKGIKQAQTASSSLGQTIANVGFVLNGLTATFNLVAGVVKKVTKTMGDCTEAYKVQLYAERALDVAVKNNPMMNGESAKNLKQFASDIQKVSNFGDEQLIPLIAKLTTMGRTEEESMKIIKTATDMASTGTVSLETAINQLNMTMNGNIGRLGLQNAELLNLSKEELRAGKAVEVLGKKYKGMAQATIDPTKQLNNLVGDLKETIGSKLIPIVDDFKKRSIVTVNELINKVQGLDFSKVYAVFVSMSDIVTNSIKNLIDRAKELKQTFTDVINNIDWQPLISVVDTVIGLFSKGFGEAREKFESFKKTVAGLKGIGAGIDFGAVANVINTVLDGLYFLYQKMQEIKVQIQEIVKNLITNVWGYIKEIFQGTQEALQNGMEDIKSWGDFFWSYFDNVFRIFQDVLNGISAILRGDWAVAWEYAKLTVLRAVNSILDLISMVMNAFPKLINGIIDKINDLIRVVNSVREFFGQDPLGLVEAFDGVDLAKSSGLETQIEKTVGKIEELTGKSADVSIKNIERISVESAGFIDRISDKFMQLADSPITVAQATQEVFEETADIVGDTYDKFSEWDSKLLKQRQDDLEEYENEYHEIQLKIIEEERKKAIEADKTGEDIAKINKYYDNEIVKENERAEKAKRGHAKETVQQIIDLAKNMASTIKNVYSKITSTVKNVLGSVKNIFSKLFSFNVDDALDNLLKFEDMVLTFFVETLPKLPQFFQSAIQSVIVLIQTVLNMLDFDVISSIVENILTSILNGITSIASMFNQNAEKITNGLTQLVATVIQSLANWVESGGWKELLNAIINIQKMIENVIIENIDELVDTIISMLPDLIEALKQSIVSASKTLGKLAPKILPLIADIINAIIEVITSDEVLESFFEAVEGIVDGLVQAIIKLLTKAVPKLVQFGTKLATNPQTLTKLVASIISGLINAFAKTNWGQVVKDIFTAFIDAFKNLFGIHSPSTLFEGFGTNMVEGLINGLKGIAEAVNAILEPLYNLVANIFSGIGDTITNSIDVSLQGLIGILESIGDVIGNLTDISFQGLNDIIGTVSGSLNDLAEISLGGLVDMLNWVGDITEFTVTSAFEGLCDIIESSSSAFAEITYSVSDLIDSLADLIEQVNKAVSALNPFGGGGGESTAERVAKALATGGLSEIFRHANGTNNAQRGIALVGEAGPELIRFNGGEQVLNNRNTNKALSEMGGTTINQSVTFNNLQDTTAFAMMNQLKQYNRKMAINGVL